MDMKPAKHLALSGLMLGIGLVLPFLTGQIPELGARLLPLHLPVLLCGFLCPWPYSLAVGLILPLFRSLLFSMPPMFPTAAAMSLELAIYGLVTSLLYHRLPKRPFYVYVSLMGGMLCGRIAWGAASYLLLGLSGSQFNLALFWAGAFANAVPGILLQLILIPILVFTLKGAKLLDE